MMRARWSLASLLALSLTDCALTDDYAFAEAESTKAGAPPADKGGSTGGASPLTPGGIAGMPLTGGVGGGSGGSSGGMTAKTAPPAATGGMAGEVAAGKGGEPATCLPAPEICDGISNDCDDEIDEGAACPTGCDVESYDGHLYALCLFVDEDDWLTYEQATSACTKLAGKLGSKSEFALTWIESEDENDFLKTWIVETTPIADEVMIWSGANDLDKERTWVWGRGPGAERFFDQASDGGGTPYDDSFHDFPAGKPNSANDWDEDCGGFDSELDWQWNDFICDDPRLGYVCEEKK